MSVLKKYYAKRTDEEVTYEYYVMAEDKEKARERIHEISGEWLKVTDK